MLKNMLKENALSIYTRLMEVDTNIILTSDKLLPYLAQLIDSSFDLGKIEGILKALDIIEIVNVSQMKSEERANFYYCAANAWLDKYQIEYSNDQEKKSFWEFEPEFEKIIFFLRSSINEEKFVNLDNQIKCSIYTNLANALDKVGRFIEAIEYWDRAIEIDSKHGMALGNIGFGQIKYANLIYDPGHQGLFLKDACVKLRSAINALSNVHEYSDALQSFKRTLDSLEKKWANNLDHSCLTKPFSLGRSNAEKRYRQWCLLHRLFLNPLNDLGNYTIAARDVLTTPNMVTPLNVGPRYQGFYNQIKQEFISARFMCYEGITSSTTHFADRGVILYNTLDYPTYCIAIEKVKMSFKVAYSLFDKIAYFLNEYFGFGIKPNNVYFRTIWFIDKKEVRPILTSKENPALQGLYWLSKDLFAEEEYRDSVEPDAQNLYNIRNHLEHKYLKVHELLFPTSDDEISKSLHDDLAYSIERNAFEQKTIRLLRLVRNALCYLSLAIHNEEIERDKKRDINEVIFPFNNVLWNDNWKK